MSEQLKTSTWTKKAGLCCVGAALAVAVGCGVSYAVENAGEGYDEAKPAIEYETNGMGLTYGTCASAPAYDDMPDLVLVVATNGQEGYVYREALEEAEGGFVEQPEELLARTQEQDEVFVEAFTESLQADGHDVSQEMIEGFVDEARFGAGVDCAATELADKIEANAAATAGDAQTYAASGAEEIDRDIEDALALALQASGTVLPVYDVDGETVIGEFLVAGV